MIKRVISAFCAFIFMIGSPLFVTREKKEPVSVPSKVDHVYKSTDIALPENVRVVCLLPSTEGAIAFCTESSKETYETRKLLIYIGTDGSIIKTELIDTVGVNDYIPDAVICPDGGVLLLENSYDIVKNKQMYYLSKYKDGEYSLICEDVESLFDFHFDNFYPTSLAVDKDMNIIIATGSLLACFDKDVKKHFEIEINGYINDIDTTSEGRFFVNYNTGSSRKFQYIDVSKRELGNDIPLPSSIWLFYADLYNGPGYDFYIGNGCSIYGYNVSNADREPVELLNWINSDIDRSGIREIAIIDEKTFIAYYNNFSFETGSGLNGLYLLKKVPNNEIPERYLINLTVNNLDYELPSKVVRFNRNNDKYRVVVTDWSVYNTDKNFSRGKTMLNNEILAGNVPDIILTSNFSGSGVWKSSGVFTDLYELMEKDESFDRSLLFDSVLKKFEENGKLYELAMRFSLETYMAKKSNLPFEKWNITEYFKFADSLPEGTYLTSYASKYVMINFLLNSSFDSFVDSTNGTCSFDDGEFAKILKFINGYGDNWYYEQTLSGEYLTDYLQDRNKPLRENKIILDNAYIHSIASYLSSTVSFGGEDTVCVGYPTSSGNGVLIRPINTYAIANKSIVKNGAWDFIKFILIESGNEMSGFPTLKSRFDYMAEKEMEYNYLFYFKGGYSSWQKDIYYNMNERKDGILRDITQADVEAVRSLIEGVNETPTLDKKLTEIVYEEAVMYFYGYKTLEETVKIIQNRAGIYLAENK